MDPTSISVAPNSSQTAPAAFETFALVTLAGSPDLVCSIDDGDFAENNELVFRKNADGTFVCAVNYTVSFRNGYPNVAGSPTVHFKFTSTTGVKNIAVGPAGTINLSGIEMANCNDLEITLVGPPDKTSKPTQATRGKGSYVVAQANADGTFTCEVTDANGSVTKQLSRVAREFTKVISPSPPVAKTVQQTSAAPKVDRQKRSAR